MMEPRFPLRTRKQLKDKFKREERKRGRLVDQFLAVRCRGGGELDASDEAKEEEVEKKPRKKKKKYSKKFSIKHNKKFSGAPRYQNMGFYDTSSGEEVEEKVGRRERRTVGRTVGLAKRWRRAGEGVPVLRLAPSTSLTLDSLASCTTGRPGMLARGEVVPLVGEGPV